MGGAGLASNCGDYYPHRPLPEASKLPKWQLSKPGDLTRIMLQGASTAKLSGVEAGPGQLVAFLAEGLRSRLWTYS